ncbi:MAG: 50S ribosomal protein L10 [Candidatus Micrarchaeota archaeon]|nr:MAG: 50S ribosomal protein L10 [Candidatus Micrarchaeota archaeon]
MLTRREKERYVKELANKINSYKTVAIIDTSEIKSRVLQRIKAEDDMLLIKFKNTLIRKALEASNKKELAQSIANDVALILTNRSPTDLKKLLDKYTEKKWPKPGKEVPVDIVIKQGPLPLMPQNVAEAKSLGLEIQVQKGSVVLQKDKKILEKGKKATNQIVNFLRAINFAPLESRVRVIRALMDKLVFDGSILDIDDKYCIDEITKTINAVYAISKQTGILTPLTAREEIVNAYRNAIYIAIERAIYDKAVIDKLIAKAELDANAIRSKINL